MSLVLVDSSVWIDTFKAQDPLDLEAWVPIDCIVTCPQIIQEVLQGFDDERAFRIAQEAMTNLTRVGEPCTLDLYIRSAQLYRHARKKGVTVRSSIDCVIATLAIQHDLQVLHKDRDFDNLSRVSPLHVRSVTPHT